MGKDSRVSLPEGLGHAVQAVTPDGLGPSGLARLKIRSASWPNTHECFGNGIDISSQEAKSMEALLRQVINASQPISHTGFGGMASRPALSVRRFGVMLRSVRVGLQPL